MDSSTGHYAPQASRGGSDPTSPESGKDDALLQSTWDEVAELFRINEVFPFEEEAEDVNQEPEGEVRKVTRRGIWRRIADWCFGRAPGPG